MNMLLARILVLTFAVAAGALQAQVPQLVNYQGRVGVNGVNFDGSGQFKFALVNAAGTTTYWSNDGTSTAGGEPAAAITLSVTKGLYSVLLGDATSPNMTLLPATVFTHGDVHLRAWFNDGTHGFQLLSPDKRIAAVGYAMMAGSVPDEAITAAKIAPGAIESSHLAPGLILGGTTSGTFNGGLTGNVAGNATNFTGSLVGDVTGTQGATVVVSVGTSTAASIHTAEVAANGATSANNSGTLVKRDSSGNFAAGTMTGNVTGSAASFTGPLAGDVTGTQGATSISAATVTGKALTGFSSTTGSLTVSDSVLSAIGKLDGNMALKAPLASPTFTGTVSGSFSGPLTGNVTGSAASFTGPLAGDVMGTQGATNISAATVTGKTLTGFSSSTGSITVSDSVLSAIGKLDGNIALKAPLASPTFTGTVSGSFSGPLTGNVTGSAASFTGLLAGDVTGTQVATSISAATVTGKALTGYASAAGTVGATDSILSAINKLNGNDALKAPLASPTFTGTLTLPAGTATSAPLLLKTGTSLTTPAFGALEFDGTNVYVTTDSVTPTRKTLAFTDSAAAANQPTWIFADEKSTGVNGGSASGGWDARTLNTVRFTSGAACTLSGNQFTLQPGSYTIRASAPAYAVFSHRMRLHNMTDDSWVVGSSEYCATGIQTRSMLTVRVQLSSAKVFRIEHYCRSNTGSSSNLGAAFGAGSDNEVYTIVEISQ